MLVKIVDCAIHPEEVIAQAKTNNSGCVVSYVGLIRDNSYEKAVQSVEYRDQDGLAESRLTKLAAEIASRFKINNLAMVHRTGVLKVGEINIVFALACGHRQEGSRPVLMPWTGLKRACPPGRRRPIWTVLSIRIGERLLGLKSGS